jgi:serine/threonine-protein kinase
LFSSSRNGSLNLFGRAADGADDVKLVFAAKNQYTLPASWSIDGKTLICTSGSESNFDITALLLEGDPELKPLLNGKHQEGMGKISPDGRWMAYVSTEEGQFEIYVRPYPGVEKDRIKVSTNGGFDHLWSPDGKELYYRNGEAVLAVSIETEHEFEAGRPRTLFHGPYSLFPLYSAWDISPDGERFLMMKEYTEDTSTGETMRPRINIVLNWFEELKDRVPTD